MIFGKASRAVAATFALASFAIAIVAGLAVGNDALHVLSTALICMIICQIVGLLVGAGCERAVTDFVEQYKESTPVPDPSSGGRKSTEEVRR